MTPTPQMRVGFIGMGNMGAPVAQRIIAAGFPTTLWARSESTLAPFRSGPASFATDVPSVGAACDLVGLCVRDDATVEAIVLAQGLLDSMPTGAVLAIHSTVHPDLCRRLGALGAERGVDVVDAPVSGGAHQAELGNLAVMVGGDPGVFERCRPVFETFGSLVRLLGPLGAGQLAKLVNNTVFTVQSMVAAEALELGGALGLDRDSLSKVLHAASAQSFAMDIFAARRIALEDWGREPGAQLLQKDVGLTTDVAAGLDAGRLLLRTAEASLERMHLPLRRPRPS
jgi:3-hydroxyisobutyrate dehydrogenase-like beta-hydroxyacid dehydrogenase